MWGNQYIPFICTCGCGSAPNTCGCKKIKTQDIVYIGPTLPCMNIACNAPLNDIIQKLEEVVCNMNTTTSTTSSTSTSTTSTTTTTTTVPNCRYIEMVVAQVIQDAPTYTVLETNFTPSLSITTQRLGVGQYLITFNGPNVPAMNNNTTLVLTGTNNQSVSTFVNLNELYLYTYLADGLTPADEVLANPFSIYIKHCNALPII